MGALSSPSWKQQKGQSVLHEKTSALEPMNIPIKDLLQWVHNYW